MWATVEGENCNGQQVQLGKQRPENARAAVEIQSQCLVAEKVSPLHPLHAYDLWSSSAFCCAVLKKMAEI